MPHKEFMHAALRLAGKGLGRTSPNPAVGSVIVRGGRIISCGYHRRAGSAHAEIEALAGVKELTGATLYVTLEPCCHFGRTPPCTDSIISSNIKKVVVGTLDPNPRVSGKGVAALRRAGIDVTTGVLKLECARLNEAYNVYIRRRTPFVTLKLAMSLDGRIATSAGESKWITSAKARKEVHRLRSINDAVMVGSGTLLEDDPELNVRLVAGRSPARVVLDSALSTPVSAKVYNGVKEGRARLIIFTGPKATGKKAAQAESLGAEVIKVPASPDGLSSKAVMKELGKREMTGVLVEGGGRLAASLITAGLVDKYILYYGPVIIGGDGIPAIAALGIKGLSRAPGLSIKEVKTVGGSLSIECYPSKRSR